MRLDHLLSKREEVRVVLLFSYRVVSKHGDEAYCDDGKRSFLKGAGKRSRKAKRTFESIEKERSVFEIAKTVLTNK